MVTTLGWNTGVFLHPPFSSNDHGAGLCARPPSFSPKASPTATGTPSSEGEENFWKRPTPQRSSARFARRDASRAARAASRARERELAVEGDEVTTS